MKKKKERKKGQTKNQTLKEKERLIYTEIERGRQRLSERIKRSRLINIGFGIAIRTSSGGVMDKDRRTDRRGKEERERGGGGGRPKKKKEETQRAQRCVHISAIDIFRGFAQGGKMETVDGEWGEVGGIG